MKISLTLNWVRHFVELTPGELDTLNNVLSRAKQVKDEGTTDNVPVIELSPSKLEFKINVLPQGTQTNEGE
jgi:hypothetical protein